MAQAVEVTTWHPAGITHPLTGDTSRLAEAHSALCSLRPKEANQYADAPASTLMVAPVM
jgi:hypothetical protein